MVLSGACPGTLLTQVATGVTTGVFALLGSSLGGIIWSGFLSKAIKKHNAEKGIKSEISTFENQLGLSRPATVVLFQIICAGAVAATMAYTERAPEPKVLGVVGGLLIGGAQLFSIITRRTMMGVSGSYEEFGSWFWWLFNAGSTSEGRPGYKNILFASGMAGGAYTLAQLVPELVGEPASDISPLLATLGGAAMTIGSRMAGGCTSGHGISGMSLLSTSSFVTIASAFATGGLVATFLN
jgi:uncharacterized membrane protein YedE/YeeE